MNRRDFFKTILGKGTKQERFELEEQMATTTNFHDFAEYVKLKSE